MTKLLTLLLVLLLYAQAGAVVFPLSPEIPGDGIDNDANGQVDEAVTESITQDPYAAGQYQFKFSDCGKVGFNNVVDAGFFGGMAAEKPTGSNFRDGEIVCTGTMPAGTYKFHVSYSSTSGPRGLWLRMGQAVGNRVLNSQATVFPLTASPRWQKLIYTGTSANFVAGNNGGADVSFAHSGGLFILAIKSESDIRFGCGYLTNLTTPSPVCPGEVSAGAFIADYTILELGTNAAPTAWNSAVWTNANVMQFTGAVSPSVCAGTFTVKMLWDNATTDRLYASINCADTSAQIVSTTNDAAGMLTSAEDKVDIRWRSGETQVCDSTAYIVIGNLQPVFFDGNCATGTYTSTQNLTTTVVKNVVASTSWNMFIAANAGSITPDANGRLQMSIVDNAGVVAYFKGSSTAVSQWGNVKFSSTGVIPPPPSDVTPPNVTSPLAATTYFNRVLITGNTDEQGTCRVYYGTSTGVYTLQSAGSASVNGVCSEMVTGLSGSTPYFFQLRVTDAVGNPGVSTEVTATTSNTLDNFNRADGTPGTDWAGSYTGGIDGTIVGSRIRVTALSTTMLMTWIGTTVDANQGAETTLAGWSGAYMDSAILLRWADTPTKTGYYALAGKGTTGTSAYTTAIYKCTAGSCGSPVARNLTQTWAAGDRLKATAVGGTISIYRNGSLVLTYVDPSPIATGKTGIGGFIRSDGALTAFEIDDFDTYSVTSVPAYWVNPAAAGQNCVKFATDPGPTGSSKTVMQGINCAGSGDTVWVRTGTYAENIYYDNTSKPVIASGTANARTTISAYPGDTVTIRSVGLYNIAAQYITFNGFIIDKASAAGEAVLLFSNTGVYPSYIRITNNEIKNAGTQGVLALSNNEFTGNNIHNNGTHTVGGVGQDHGMYIQGGSNLIENNLIHDNWAYGIQMFRSAGGVTNNIIRNNKIYNNSQGGSFGYGILLAHGDNNVAYNNVVYGNYGGIRVAYTSPNAKVYNNTVAANTAIGINIDGTNVTDALVKNNIVYGNVYSGIADTGTRTIRDYNLCSGANATTNCGTNYATGEPVFVDLPGRDFHLQGTSAAINTGTNLGTSYNRDYDNVLRPVGPWEIGAYEYVP